MGFQNFAGNNGGTTTSLAIPPNTLYATTSIWEGVKNDLTAYRNIFLTSHSNVSQYLFDAINIPHSLKIEGFLSPFQYNNESSQALSSQINVNEGLELKNLKFEDLTFTANELAWLNIENCIINNLTVTENVMISNITTSRINGIITNTSGNLITLDYVVMNALPNINFVAEESVVVVAATRNAYILLNNVWELLGQNSLSTQSFSTVSPFRLAILLLSNRVIDGGLIP